MNMDMLILLIGCLLFAGAGGVVNYKATEVWLKVVSMGVMLTGLFMGGFVLVMWFMQVFGG